MRYFTKKDLILLTAVCIVTISVCLANYSIDWYTIDGGGATSTGGTYTITGTIGQPDAGYSYQGEYYLAGGYWTFADLCFVDYIDLAIFSQYWLYTGPDLPADLDGDTNVNMIDLRILAEEWLSVCPANWPL